MLFKRIQENFAVHKKYPHSFYYKEFNDSEKTYKKIYYGESGYQGTQLDDLHKDGGYTFYDFLVFFFLGGFALSLCYGLIDGFSEKGYIIVCFGIIAFCAFIAG
tara:strand:- start:308 stop:619 length:312 start_codon:yes stop_codon:yes gene_type:complete